MCFMYFYCMYVWVIRTSCMSRCVRVYTIGVRVKGLFTKLSIVSDAYLMHRIHVSHAAAVRRDAFLIHRDLLLQLSLLGEVG